MDLKRLEGQLIEVSGLVAIIIQGLSGTQIISTTCLSISQQNIVSHIFLCMYFASPFSISQFFTW